MGARVLRLQTRQSDKYRFKCDVVQASFFVLIILFSASTLLNLPIRLLSKQSGRRRCLCVLQSTPLMSLCVAFVGCCFLTYTTKQEADKAIEIFHNKRTLQPVKHPFSSLVCELRPALSQAFPRPVFDRWTRCYNYPVIVFVVTLCLLLARSLFGLATRYHRRFPWKL